MLILLLILFVLTWTPGLIYEALVAFQRHFPGAVGMFTIIIRHVSHPGSPLYWLGCLLTITDILLPKTVFHWEERTRSTCHPDTNDDILQLKGFWCHPVLEYIQDAIIRVAVQCIMRMDLGQQTAKQDVKHQVIDKWD